MAYGGLVIQRNISFTVQPAEIFVVMGGSGCGKSTLLRHLVGLKEPARGDVLYDGRSLWTADPAERDDLTRRGPTLHPSHPLPTPPTPSHTPPLPTDSA